MTIRLAHRLQRIQPSATVTITARAGRLREAGRDIIVLSVGEPDFPTPEHIKAAAREALERNDTKYTAVDGSRALKEAVVTKFERDNGLRYTPDQVLISSGAKQSCHNACLALLGPGDEAIVLAPYWVSYPDMVRLADAEPVIVESAAHRGFKITAEQLEAAITPRTRLVILNSPCNPTGAVYTRADWVALGEVLRRHPNTLTVNGMSKGYAMSGWRLGYAAGPVAVIKAMTSLQSQSTTNASTISQAAARAALVGDQQCVRDMCAEFRRRHDLFFAGVRELPGFDCVPASGTFYLFPNVEQAMRQKGTSTDIAFCEQILEATGVALVPGTAFGAPGHLRFSFAASVETLTTALARLGEFMAA